jgi:Peptidase family C25/Propeptide_C25
LNRYCCKIRASLAGRLLYQLLWPMILVVPMNSSAAQAEGFRLVSSDEKRIEVEFELPAWRIEALDVQGRVFSVIHAAGAAEIKRSGYPVVPAYKALLALPPGSSVEVRWQSGTVKEQRVPLPLPAQPSQESLSEYQDRRVVTSYGTDFNSAGVYPAAEVVNFGPKRFRDVLVLELLVQPFACLPSTGVLKVTGNIRITVNLNQRQESRQQLSTGYRQSSRVFEDLYRNTLLNYESSKSWRLPAAGRGAVLASSPFMQGDRWISLHLGGSDMYAVTPEQLSSAGMEVQAVDPATFRLFTGGGRMLEENLAAPEPALTEVAVRVTGSEDGSFDTGDRIIFFGQGVDRFTVDGTGSVSSIRHRYDNQAVYWLTWQDPSASALRMNEYNSSPPSTGTPVTSAEIWYHFEENTEYLTVKDLGDENNPAPDYWAWSLDEDQAGKSERPFDLGIIPEQSGHFFRCQFYAAAARQNIGYTLALNGVEVGAGTHYSYHALTSDWLPLPQNLLSSGSNTFTLTGQEQVPGFFELRVNKRLSVGPGERYIFHQVDTQESQYYEMTVLDSELDIYDLTNPVQPERITGIVDAGQDRVRFGLGTSSSSVRSFAVVAAGAYATPELIRAEQIAHLRNLSGAEYLVISPGELFSHAENLAALRSNEYKTEVVAVEDIYNEFSLGLVDPAAIRNFLKYTFENWSVVPEFVVFLGDGHNDFRGNTAVGRSRANYIVPFIDAHNLAIEEWFVRVGGSNLPQIAHGRIPIQSQGEAAIVVDKIVKYEQSADAGDWVRRAVMVADDGYVLGGACDPVLSPNHVSASEQLDSLLPEDMERKKVYLQQYPFDPPGIGTRKPAASSDLVSWWNRGALIVNYIGHGSPLHWAQERVFDVEQDLLMLTNGYRLPLVLNASCSIGHFDDYNSQAMAERLLTFQGGGAIAAYAATRVTYAGQNLALSRFFMDALFSEGGSPIGTAALKARMAVSNYYDVGNAQRYSIFGDPALQLHTPGRELHFEIENTSSLRVGDKVTFTGTVNDNTGSLDNSFSGVARVKFLGAGGSPLEINYECTYYGSTLEKSVRFFEQPGIIFDGPVTVAGGRFSGAMVLPLNLAGSLPVDTLNLESGRFMGYATSEVTDGSGVSLSMAVSRQSGALSDTSAPKLGLFYRGMELSDGERVSISEPLLLVLKDESGINTTGSPGVQLSLEVDEGMTYAADLTSLFTYSQDSYQEGTVSVDLAGVGTGLHALRFRATDNLLNSASAEWMLELASSAGGLTLSGVLNYPNPFKDQTDICFEVSAPADVLIRIFTVAGRPVRELKSYGAPAGFNTIHWDGTDEYRQKIANGVYLYKIICRSLTGGTSNSAEEVEAIGKALLSR